MNRSFTCLARCLLALGVGMVPAVSAQELEGPVDGSFYAPLPQASTPFRVGESPDAWLQPKPSAVVTETEVGFDTRAVTIRQYLKGNAETGLDSVVLWQAYYPELSDYLEDALLEKRRELVWKEMTRRSPKDTSTQTTRFELPVKVPEWAMRLGVDKPNLSLTGDYKFRIKSSSSWTSLEENPQKMPSFEPDQEPNVNLVGNIGKLIHIQLTWTKDGFGVSNNQLLQIRYAGEKPEDTEDDILQEAEFGYINFSMPGTQLTGYTEQASGLVGLKAKLRFGDLDMTLIGGGEKGEKQRQKLGTSATEQVQRILDRAPEEKAWFLDRKYRAEFGANGGNYTAMEAPLSVRLFVRVTVTDLRNNPSWAPVYPGYAVALNEAGAEIPSAKTGDDDKWIELVNGTDYTLKGGVVLLGNTTKASAATSLSGALGAIYSAHGLRYGSLTAGRLKLALLSMPGDPVEIRPLSLRNRYRMPITAIAASDRQYMKVRILDKSSSKADKSVNDAGVEWSKIFGLVDAAGQLKISDANIFDWDRMEISFPAIEPFAAHGRKLLYDSSRSNLNSLPEKFEIEITSKSKSSVFNIGGSSNVSSSGCMDIIEGSEILMLNGSTRLVKGQDYDVIYNIGQITLLSQRALDPSSDISIDYQCTPFFSLETKTLLGGRLEYELPVGKPKESLLGATLLYRSETVTDPRPQLKREPNLSWLWGLNLRLQSESDWLTDLAGHVPFVTPRGESRWKLELEGAQTYNDPNTGTEALVDDFENSKVENSLPLTRTSWFPASPPGGVPGSGAEYDTAHNYWHKGLFVWHSNSSVRLRDIYPNWSDGNATPAQQSILQLKLQPNDPGLGHSWGGIMRPFTDKDLSKSSVLEIVVRGAGGVLNFDLGSISEDISLSGAAPSGTLNSEDIDSTGYQTGRPPLYDRGLDGLAGEQETSSQWYCPGVQCGSPTEIMFTPGGSPDPAGDNFQGEGEANDPSRAINGTEDNNKYIDGTVGTSTYFDTEDLNRNGTLDTVNSFNRFRIHLGGDSATSYQALSNGWRLYRIRLEDPDRKVGGGARWNNVQAMRMWFTGLTSRNGANQQEERLQIARLSLVGNQWTESGRLARNDSIWISDSLYTSGVKHVVRDTLQDSNSLQVTVVSKQENSRGYRNWNVPDSKDASTGAVANEQSLRLTYRGLRAFGLLDSAAGTATRSFTDARDLTLYKRFQLFVYHQLQRVQTGAAVNQDRLNALRAEPSKPLRMSIRLGSGTPDDSTAEFYEYSWNLRSVDCAMGDTGSCALVDTNLIKNAMSDNWMHNSLDIPLAAFTRLKDSGSVALRKSRIYRSKIGPEDMTAAQVGLLDFRQDSVLVKGNPSLSNIQWIRYILRPDELGPGERISGEVWVNDLKLSDPQRGIGSAVRGSFEFNLADLFSASASASLTEGNFVPMGQRRVEVSKAATSGSASFDTRLSLNKFLPESWKVQMPIGYGSQTSISRPWMRPGSDRSLTHDGIGEVLSDLFTGELERDSAEQRYSTSRAYQTLSVDNKTSWSYKKEVTSDHSAQGYLVNLLFERPRLSWTHRTRGAQQPERLDTSSQHDVEFGYDFSPKVPSWKPFDKSPAWAPGIVNQLEFMPLPNRIDATVASISYQESSRRTLDPDNDTLIGNVDRQRTATLSHSLSTEWDPLGFLRTSHRIQSGRTFDYDQSRSFDPSRGFPGMLDLALSMDTTVVDASTGRQQGFGLLKAEQNRTQSLTIDATPQLASWLTTTGTFSSSATLSRQSPVVIGVDTLLHDTARVTYWRDDVRDGFRSQMRFNLTSLLTTLGSVLPTSVSPSLQTARKGFERFRFSGIGFDYSVDNTASGNQASLSRMEAVGLDAWGLERYNLGLGDGEGFRTPWDLITGSRSKEGFGQYQPSRLSDTGALNSSKRNMRALGYDYTSLSNQRSYRVSSSTDFTLPKLDLTLRPSTSYSTSWEERWYDPVNVDTTTTWPQVGVGADWANFVPKLPFLGGLFQSVTMSHSASYDMTTVVHPHSATSDREDESWKFSPLVGLNLRTKNGLWTIDNKFSYATTTSVSKAKSQRETAPEGAQGVLADPIYWYDVVGSSIGNGSKMGNDLTATYRIQTRKGIQILKWFFKLESDLVISFTGSWSHEKKSEEIWEGANQTRNQPTQDLTTFKVGTATSYSFTPKLSATANAYYTRRDQSLTNSSETAKVENEIQMLFELAYRF